MEFNESVPPLVGYLERDDPAMETWYGLIDQKIPLRLKSKNASWSLRIHRDQKGADPTFSLVLGFRSDQPYWKPLDMIKVIDMHVVGDHVFLDVVNMEADNAMGCIVIRPEDCTVFDHTWMESSAKNLGWPFLTVTQTFIETKLNLFRGTNLETCRDLAEFVKKGYSVTARGIQRVREKTEKRKAALAMGSDPAEGSTGQKVTSGSGSGAKGSSKGKEPNPTPSSTARHDETTAPKEHASKSQRGSLPIPNRDGIIACLQFSERSLRNDRPARTDDINASRSVVNSHSRMYMAGRRDAHAIPCRLHRSFRQRASGGRRRWEASATRGACIDEAKYAEYEGS